MPDMVHGMADSLFLSTPSARRATRGLPRLLPCMAISIHALREEGDFGGVYIDPQFERFLSTPSARRATFPSFCTVRHYKISIHALREEGDKIGAAYGNVVENISIHALREEGDLAGCQKHMGRTISIHALREEGDIDPLAGSPEESNFYPRPPRGGRRLLQVSHITVSAISIHALREEGDQLAHRLHRRVPDFYPRPPRGGRQQKQRQNLYFQINYTTFCTNLEEP